MDFTQSGSRPSASQGGASNGGGAAHRKKKAGFEWLKISTVTLLFGITVLIVGVILLMSIGTPNQESKLVNTSSHQAIFLSNGQVYFGNITALNDKYLRISDLYYLRQTESPQPDKGTSSNFSLVKLGCEIHGPNDEMIVNRDQLSFWENLKKDGKVVKAIEDFKKNNPDGQKCANTTNSTTPTTDKQ